MKQHKFQPGKGARPICIYREGVEGPRCTSLEESPIHDIQVMTEEHEDHLRRIQASFQAAVELKYRAGVRQHGGRLWEKPGLIEKAMEECVDQYVFLYTLKMQRDNPGMIDPNARDIDE